MDGMFEKIIDSLKKRKSINEVTNAIKLNIANGHYNTSNIFLAFIRYLQAKCLNANNSITFELIEKYFNDQITLPQLSQELFFKKIVIDDDKREGHQSQFYHEKDETFLDEIFRVLYEFSRGDLVKPKGVCFDFCLFIAGLSIAKNDGKRIYIWNSIEKDSGVNNFVLFCVEGNNVLVYDPFNGMYLPLDKYDKTNVGFRLIELNDTNILKASSPLTAFDIDNSILYSQVQEMFRMVKHSGDKDLILSESQNYYKKSDIDMNASFDEIKASFRRKIAKFHPDINPNDKHATEKAQLIIEAYDCLKNDALRRQYNSIITGANINSKPDNNAQDGNDGINIDDEIEVIIREFKRKYHFDSYEKILKLLKKISSEIAIKTATKDYFNNKMIIDTKKKDIIYDVEKIVRKDSR